MILQTFWNLKKFKILVNQRSKVIYISNIYFLIRIKVENLGKRIHLNLVYTIHLLEEFYIYIYIYIYAQGYMRYQI